jgi:hypothetical protein
MERVVKSGRDLPSIPVYDFAFQLLQLTGDFIVKLRFILISCISPTRPVVALSSAFRMAFADLMARTKAKPGPLTRPTGHLLTSFIGVCGYFKTLRKASKRSSS